MHAKKCIWNLYEWVSSPTGGVCFKRVPLCKIPSQCIYLNIYWTGRMKVTHLTYISTLYDHLYPLAKSQNVGILFYCRFSIIWLGFIECIVWEFLSASERDRPGGQPCKNCSCSCNFVCYLKVVDCWAVSGANFHWAIYCVWVLSNIFLHIDSNSPIC